MTVAERVLEYLASVNEPKGNIQIGLALGYGYISASAAVTPALKALVKAKKVERIPPSGGRSVYRIKK